MNNADALLIHLILVITVPSSFVHIYVSTIRNIYVYI